MSRKAAVALAVVTAAMATATAASSANSVVATRTVGTVTTIDHRAVIVASKAPEGGGGGGAPTAQVSVAAYARAKGGWHRVAERRLSGTFFWKTVIAPHALCRLEVASSGTSTATQLRVTVQLLTSPSIGCARPETLAFPAS